MDYILPLLTLIISLYIFHLVFIKLKPQDKRFWKKVDYLWVSLGVIGIIGATFTLRKEYAIATMPWHKYSLENDYNEYIIETKNQYHYFADKDGFDYKLFEDKTKAEKFIQSGIMFDSLHQISLKYKEQILVKKEYNYLDTITKKQELFLNTIKDDNIIKTSELATYLLKRSKEEATFLEEAENQTNRGHFNWLLLFISPYVFALAIAIRITKITAELKEI